MKSVSEDIYKTLASGIPSDGAAYTQAMKARPAKFDACLAAARKKLETEIQP